MPTAATAGLVMAVCTFLGSIGVVVLASLALARALPAVTTPAAAMAVAAPTWAGPIAPRPGASAAGAIAFAWRQLGEPYRWGGAGPGSWDCSGLVMAAYATVGMALPHNAQAQYDATSGATVALDRLQAGDLVFFGPDLAAIGHVGIYVGGGDMIDAPHAGATVRVESIHWSDLLVASRPMPSSGPTG